METKNILNKEIWIKSSIQKVFKSFTNAESMLEWHGKEVEVNPVPGGIYKVVFENGTTILGEYLEVEFEKRIVYTAKYDDIESVVSIDFIEENGGVRIKIKQEFSEGQDTSSFNEGWDYFLAILKNFFEFQG